MKHQAKVFGKKQPWNDASPEFKKQWTFERRPGGWVIASHARPDGTIERVRFSYHQVKGQVWAKLPNSSVTHAIDFYGERTAVARAGAQGDSASDFTAQFPGKVRKVMVKEGQTVAADTPLVMIEAMKMEFAIKSSEPGVVAKILVEEGQQLSPGQKLLLFEASPKEGTK
jgi:acetyl-CoA/propionyl-CoA carboxylase biotin carboxyl carrier protein